MIHDFTYTRPEAITDKRGELISIIIDKLRHERKAVSFGFVGPVRSRRGEKSSGLDGANESPPFFWSRGGEGVSRKIDQE